MELHVEHRVEQDVLVLSTPLSLSSLAHRAVAAGAEVVVVDGGTGVPLVRYTMDSPNMTLVADTRRVESGRDAPSRERLNAALARYGLGVSWESLLAVAATNGWSVIPGSTPSPRGQSDGAPRRIVLGLGETPGRLTVDGWGGNPAEALGWAVTRALEVRAVVRS